MAFSKSNVFLQILCVTLAASWPADLLAQDAAPASADQPDLSLLYAEAEDAFAKEDYATAATKLDLLVKHAARSPGAPLEMLHFNLGLAYLLDKKYPQAERAFRECIAKFPRGEYTSRCHLGIGRACIAQETPEKLEAAINSLRIAAADPKYRSEAGLALGKVYSDLGKPEEALTVFRSLMGSDVRTAQQTNAAVEVIGLLAQTGQLADLIAYLDRLVHQSGVRDSIAWYTNQVVVLGDDLVGKQDYNAALAIYRSVLPRRQILSIQTASRDKLQRELAALEKRVEAQGEKEIGTRSTLTERLNDVKSAAEMASQALDYINSNESLDAMLLMRRGRCLYYLDRYEEALICFREIRLKHASAAEAQTAAYSEIFVYNQLKDTAQVQKLSNEFLTKYPNAENGEQIAMLAGEGLGREGKWDEALEFYRELERKFPQSQSLDHYRFFQGVALFQQGKFAEAADLYADFSQQFPNSQLQEDVLYRVAMAYFLTNDYKKTLAACEEYLRRYPNGTYAGEIRYRLAFIDFNDRENDQSDKIIKELGDYAEANPNDLAVGSMLSLIGDVWTQKKANAPGSAEKALEAYEQAIWSSATDETVQYAIESATSILQSKKDWAGISALHEEILKRKEGSHLALISATWVAKMKLREGKGDEAADILANYLSNSIEDPANEQVEFLIDELVKTVTPSRRELASSNPDDVDKKLEEIMNKAAAGKENATTAARILYARARLADGMRMPERADLYLKSIANSTSDPAALSPVLLTVSGDILLKENKLDQAEGMFLRLRDRYQESMFADAGPVGLGQVALARKEYEDALGIFEAALTENPGMSRIREATLGKLQAFEELGRLDDAEKLALEVVGDRNFRGDTAGQAYLILADVLRKRAATQVGDTKAETLKKAHGYYQRVYVAYQAYPEISANAYWGAYEVAKELGDNVLAQETLKTLATHPKLQKTERALQARPLVTP